MREKERVGKKERMDERLTCNVKGRKCFDLFLAASELIGAGDDQFHLIFFSFVTILFYS